ncbi:cellulose biosynthesis protein BcsC [Roseomonas xinghualingensis]|uniref:cellulose biosynthesis protein BcsC n=1 Tax=Roseomonas xinghualingensis TaxID=2986475 RepID=UPI0021F1C2DE|nr:cellulose biosynthesis protein BcsC [Roseomonas sp. SXEYE001]MCV4209486.1 cellulose synthase subunit BcsC-related outer membrane protein [Roseomonas sp. SXEYE001]
MTSLRNRLLTAAATAVALGVAWPAFAQGGTAGSEPRIAARERPAGLLALDAGDLPRAVQLFEAAVERDPDDATALGGLGLVRLRQGRAAEARDILARAVAVPSSEAARWSAALRTASFLGELGEARRQLAQGAIDAAEALLIRAARRETAERAEAEALLGEIALRRGEATEAEARFRNALYRRPALPAARQGLLESFRHQGRIAEAEILQRQIARSASAEADALRAEAIRTEDPKAAIALLREAVAAAPGSAWARLDLARLLTRQGRAGEAWAVMEEALPAMPATDAAQAIALLAEEEGRLAEALRVLERIPDRIRSADQSRLLRSLRWQAELAEAAAGTPERIRPALLALAMRPDATGESGLRVLLALLHAGDRDGAAEALRLMLTANGGGSASMRTALAGALADAGVEQEVAGLLGPVVQDPGLAPAQRRQAALLLNLVAPVQVAEMSQPAPRAVMVEAEPSRLYQGARDPRVARRIAEAVLRRDPRNADARVGAIEAALAQGELDAAEMMLAEGRLLNATDPRVSVMEARFARATGDRRRAQAALHLAADQRRAQIGARAGSLALLSAPAPQSRTMLAGGGLGSSSVPQDANLAGTADGVTPSQLRASDDPLLAEIGRQLAEVNDAASGRVVPNFAFRARSGSSGLERLREYGGGVEAATPLPGVGGELSARVQAVTIDAGKIDRNAWSLNRFGTNAVAPQMGLGSPQAPRDSSATGVGLGIAYTRNGVTVDVGSTPLGFREQNILGGIEVVPRLSETSQFRLRAERRSVTDSLLSWSGMRDAASGRSFGGVVRNTAYGQYEYYSGNTGAYVGAGYSSITGNNVADNNQWQVNAGVNHAIFRTPESELVAGLDLSYFAYDKNLRLFTLGHGGYFSPQSYVSATIPIDYRARHGNLAYRLGATIGVNYFEEKRSPFFPTNGAMQAVMEAQAATDPTVSAFYPAQQETNLSAGLRGDIEYSITPSLRIGASARYDRSADYNETRGLIYARYRFDP